MSAKKKKSKVPATTALRALDAAKADYRLHAYQYVEHGGTTEAACQLGLDEHRVVKTLAASRRCRSGARAKQTISARPPGCCGLGLLQGRAKKCGEPPVPPSQ